MDNDHFYASLFPSEGVRVLAVFKNGLGSAPVHFFYDSNEDLLEAAALWDGRSRNVYHACAVYAEPTNRKGDNVAAVKALWLDLDVGEGKPYSTAKEAAQAVENFRLNVGLQPPHYVKSGGGVHAYFAFTRPVRPDQWKRMATVFAACLDCFGVQHDSSRTTDVASILRVPGTRNYKQEQPRSVKLVALGQEEPAGIIFRKLQGYADANNLSVDTPLPRGTEKADDNDLIGTKNYPPSHAERVIQHCPTLAQVELTGGDTDYETWWRAIGVARHLVDGEAVADHWTRNRATTGHGKSDWRALNWSAGPTTCAEFSKHSAACKNCAHNGTLTSPIKLGYDEQPVIEPVTPPSPRLRPWEWVFGDQRVVDMVCRATRTGVTDGKMTMSVQQEDGTYKHVSFCDRYWQVMRRVRGADNAWYLEIGFTVYPGKPHEKFLLPSADVMSAEKLRAAFSTHELHIYQGPRGMQKTQEMIRYEQDVLFGREEEIATVPVMGWVTHNHTVNGELTGDFVIGETIIRPRQPPSTVLLDPTIPSSIRSDFRTKGTTADWVALVDRVYNRGRAEPYQFAICAAFAAPLVKLLPGDGSWHGIPVALTGDSGAAKTSTALVAMSIYAPPSVLKFNAAPPSAGGDTTAGFSAKLGTLRNIPFIADEMTKADAERMSDLMFMVANGKAKDRALPTGRLADNPYRWDVLSICTGNENFHEKFSQLKHVDTKDAASLRCFEIPLAAKDLRTVFADVNRTTIDHDICGSQFGCVGRDWLQFLVNNRLKVEQILADTRSRYKIDDNDSTSIRFYKDLLLTVEVAATLAKKRGFIHWDVAAMMHWARKRLIELRDGVFQRDWSSVTSDFIGSLHGRTIVTKHFKLGRGRRANPEHPLEALSTSALPVARRATEDRLMFVTANALAEWAKDARMQPSTLVQNMVDGGYIVVRNGKVEPVRVSIGSGSTVARPNSACWELNYDMVSGYLDDVETSAGNVVMFPNAAEVVTVAVTAEGQESSVAS